VAAQSDSRRGLFYRIGSCWQEATRLLMLARVPFLLVLLGFVLVVKVEQIQELFLIAASENQGIRWSVTAWFMVGLLGLSAWYSTRTLYRFEWKTDHGDPDSDPDGDRDGNKDGNKDGDRDIQAALSRWLPRTLAMLLPMAIALTYFLIGEPLEPVSRWGHIGAYIALGLILFAVTTYRRDILRSKLVQRVLRPAVQNFLGRDDLLESEPEVGKYTRWSDIGYARHLHAFAMVILLGAMIFGSNAPVAMQAFGPLALVFGFFAMLIAASTGPVYWAARRQIPIVSMLAIIAITVTVLDLNDNHRVRLVGPQQSDQPPPHNLTYKGGRIQFSQFVDEWLDRNGRKCEQIFLVSASGGGVRAALWTAMVLSELDSRSDGAFWRCTLAVSGVSGGSLGLAAYASFKADAARSSLEPWDVPCASADESDAPPAVVCMLQSDFLSPVLGSMFGLDLLQRFIPWPWFTDRGQALEEAWIRSYGSATRSLRAKRCTFSGPLADTWCAEPSCGADTIGGGADLLPALFFNTTIVHNGKRLIQHPFAPFGADDPEFPAAVDGAEWFPSELPTSSAVLNSARFTIVSPAGTVQRRENFLETAGQVADGGYFENSGTTTITALVEWLDRKADDSPEIRVIHISNGERVPAFMKHSGAMPGPESSSSAAVGSGGGSGLAPTATPDAASRTPDDQCSLACPVGDDDPWLRGEALAPLAAILSTRDARGEFAKAELRAAVGSSSGRLWHFRLCPGAHRIPLGWTIGELSRREMERQLKGNDAPYAARLPKMTREIVEVLNASATKSRPGAEATTPRGADTRH